MRTAGDLFFYTTQQTCANAWGIPHPVGVYRVSLKVTTQNNHGYQQSMGEVIISQAVQHVRAAKSLPLPLTLPPVKAEDAVKASYPLVPPPLWFLHRPTNCCVTISWLKVNVCYFQQTFYQIQRENLGQQSFRPWAVCWPVL